MKPEVHNVSRCRQRRIEPLLQATCIKYLLKFERVVPEMLADRPADPDTDGHVNPLMHKVAKMVT